MKPGRPVVITRTQPGNARTARAVRAMGFTAIACPVSQVVRSRSLIHANGADALALTSANALQALRDIGPLLHLPVFTVGEGTAKAAREAGFASVTSADGDAEALARTIARALPAGCHVLHLSGEDRAGDLAGMLEVLGLSATTHTVYRTRLARGLTARARAALADGPAIVLIHSARGAARFLALVDAAELTAALARLEFIAISERAAVPLHTRGLKAHIAAQPAENSLLAALDELAKRRGAP
ncbi:uroporphyrinogen-III synthase [Glycocaulis abyssi]|uniref:Uroporphyrinogen-III synthase n=1 Tax=Glycocaulis abyssi TaxID=1433403 RepID=A0ABV9NC43_9PROT